MIKIFTISILLASIVFLILAIRNAYKVKKSINSIKNKKSYGFVLLNIAIAIIFVIGYLILGVDIYDETLNYRSIFISLLFLLSSIFIFISSIVTEKMGNLLFSIDKLRKLDPLTQIYNRGSIDKEIKREFERCRRYNRVSCLIMIDINKFKLINDQYGHLAGDDIIKDLANTIKNQCRAADKYGRYGGDEFIILMPETDISSAQFFYRRLKKIIEAKEIKIDNNIIKYTISIGLSSLNYKNKDYLDWLHSADISLYEAKKQRNTDIAY